MPSLADSEWRHTNSFFHRCIFIHLTWQRCDFSRRTRCCNWFVSYAFGCCCSGGLSVGHGGETSHPGTVTATTAHGAAPNATTVFMTICDDNVTDHNSITVHQAARQTSSRRQSGPTRLRTQLNEQEKEILMISLQEKAALY